MYISNCFTLPRSILRTKHSMLLSRHFCFHPVQRSHLDVTSLWGTWKIKPLKCDMVTKVVEIANDLVTMVINSITKTNPTPADRCPPLHSLRTPKKPKNLSHVGKPTRAMISVTFSPICITRYDLLAVICPAEAPS